MLFWLLNWCSASLKDYNGISLALEDLLDILFAFPVSLTIEKDLLFSKLLGKADPHCENTINKPHYKARNDVF